MYRYKSSNVQCKMLNNILFLNKLAFKFEEVPSLVHSFCLFADETPLHIFYTCNITKQLWHKFQHFVTEYLYIPEITSQYSFLGFFNIGNQQQNFLLINYLLVIFKHHLYISREHEAVCFTTLKLYLITSQQ